MIQSKIEKLDQTGDMVSHIKSPINIHFLRKALSSNAGRFRKICRNINAIVV